MMDDSVGDTDLVVRSEQQPQIAPEIDTFDRHRDGAPKDAKLLRLPLEDVIFRDDRQEQGFRDALDEQHSSAEQEGGLSHIQIAVDLPALGVV